MPKRRRNPINWQRQASWHEAEGSRYVGRAVRIPHTIVVTQDLARKEIPETLCKELTNAGFKTATVRPANRDIKCEIYRTLEQECYLQRIRPHIISQDIRNKIDTVLTHIRRQKRVKGRPRIPFTCPV